MGYSALMQSDEEESIRLLYDFKKIVQELTEAHCGKIWHFYGDGCLAAFKSTSDAVLCGEAMQQQFRDSDQIKARIGIHLGEIILTKDNIHGDAVNIASRIESMGIPNSVLFSEMVQKQLSNKTQFQSTSLGLYHFKNINKPIEVFALANPLMDVPDPNTISGKFEKKKKSKLPIYASIFLFVFAFIFVFQISNRTDKISTSEKTKKSIAVLPINNIASNEEYQNQCYGIMLALHQNLSRIKSLSLLSVSDIFSAVNKEPNMRSFAKNLSLDYYVTGNALFYNSDQSTLQIELIESEKSSSIWSNKYDYNLGDKFLSALDEIALRIVSQMEIELTDREKELLSLVPTNSSKAYDYYVQANRIAEARTQEDLERSVALLDQAIALDSSFALAYAEKASKVFAQGYYNFRTPEIAFDEAEALANKAIAIHDQVFVANSVLGTIAELVKKDKKLAESLYKRAIEVNPNDATAYRHYSVFLKRNRRYEEAISLAKRSVLLSPLGIINNLNYIDILINNDELDQALLQMDLFKTHIPDQEDQIWGYYGDIYARQGDLDKAIEYYELKLPSKPSISGELGYCYGRKNEVRRALRLIDNIPETRYLEINKALIYNGLGYHSESYQDSVSKLINTALAKGIGANVICDHPFFSNIKEAYCQDM